MASTAPVFVILADSKMLLKPRGFRERSEIRADWKPSMMFSKQRRHRNHADEARTGSETRTGRDFPVSRMRPGHGSADDSTNGSADAGTDQHDAQEDSTLTPDCSS